MDLLQFASSLSFNSANRAILLNNVAIRALPTQDVHFYNFTLPGQGYPFDNLQLTSAWAGTSAYIVGKTKDNAWYLLITPFVMGWARSEFIAKVDEDFVVTWTERRRKGLAAIVRTNTPIIDDKKNYCFSAYIGTVFPIVNNDETSITRIFGGLHHPITVTGKSLEEQYYFLF